MVKITFEVIGKNVQGINCSLKKEIRTFSIPTMTIEEEKNMLESITEYGASVETVLINKMKDVGLIN